MSFTKKIVIGMLMAVSASYAAAAPKDPNPPAGSDPVWVELTAPASISLGGGSFTYSPAASTVFVYDGANPKGGQGEAKIETLVESLFSLPASGAGSLSLVSSGDLTNGQASGPKSGSFNVGGTSGFDYLAVHYGGGELVFHWNAPLAAGSLFTFAGLPTGISNYRAYSSVTAVPEPATYGMLLGGLALMGMVARRRARK